MRSEKEIREQIKLISQTKEVAGLPVDNEIAISWLEWVLEGDGWHDARNELNITDENIQELREIILDAGSSRNYQNKQIREWFTKHFPDPPKFEEELDCCLASEESLAKDWLSPEEDEAWKDL